MNGNSGSYVKCPTAKPGSPEGGGARGGKWPSKFPPPKISAPQNKFASARLTELKINYRGLGLYIYSHGPKEQLALSLWTYGWVQWLQLKIYVYGIA